ncbi:hypothetical protein TRICI_003225 [Trichomonascus ciferrii]|uniref:RNA-binding protein VTS1 n=1 Tax=Trichomonascus ciferrii TaxID=44093 RepID=A0A642V4D2_9ASCO|nr:hypothetical protein TRICI_003225 [Trichomonascus ciferrii]
MSTGERNNQQQAPQQQGGGNTNGGGSSSPLVGRRRPVHPRGSIDLSSFDSPLVNRTRPSSEIFLHTPHKLLQPDVQPTPPPPLQQPNPYYSTQNPLLVNQQHQQQHQQPQPAQPYAQPQMHNNNGGGEIDQAAEKWLADLELYQSTLEEMATVSLDKNFKDELSSIEQWFSWLSVGERTAALYALLQQTTPVQIRFFITVLQNFANKDPISAILSPTAAERDPLQRDQLSQAHAQAAQAHAQVQQQLQQQQQQAAAAVAAATQQPMSPNLRVPETPENPMFKPSPLNNTSYHRQSLQPPRSPWTNSHEINRPKSATDMSRQQQQQEASSGLQNQLKTPAGKTHTKSYSQTPQDFNYMPGEAPSASSASWASMMNTPASNFNSPQPQKVNNEIVNSTAMKMAALSTVNGRVVLDDVKKHRRKHHIIGDFDPDNDLGLGVSVPTATAQQQQPSSAQSTPEKTRTPSKSKEVNYTDINLLQDIPSWLRSLRLHKYTDNLKDLEWKQLITLSDEDLQNRGVNALGARRKMLKIFDQIKQAYNI